MRSILPVLPPLLPLFGAVAALALGRGRRRQAVLALTVHAALLGAIAGILAHLGTDARPLAHPLGGWDAPVGIVLVADPLSALVGAVVLVVFCAAFGWIFLEEETVPLPRVIALSFLLEMGVLGALFTGDAFDFYVFFELMGLSAYALVGYRRSPAHVESSLKFAALSLVGSTLMLMGIGAIYGQTGRLAFASLRDASEAVGSPPLYLFSVGLVLAALCLKAAIVPLHFWLPDAHSIAPTAISVMLSGAVVKVGAYGVLRFLGSQSSWVWAEVRPVLLAAGAATALYCALVAVAQRDLKRLLAWSTASQMGYIVAAAALGTAAGVAAALVHVAAHAAMKAALFLCAGAAMVLADHERHWDRMGGLLARSPVLAAATLVSLLSLAGIPPLAGFVGKLALFDALLRDGAWIALTSLLLASAAMVYLAVRVWLGIFGGKQRTAGPRSPGRVALATALAGIVVALGLAAGPLVGAARRAADDLLAGDAYRAAVLGEGGGR